MKITKDSHKKLCEVFSKTLIKIGSKQFSDEELDDLLQLLLTLLVDLKRLDVDEIKESIQYLQDKKLLKVEEQLNRRLGKMKKHNYTDEVNKRLYKHFDTPISESTPQKKQDTSFEVQTKHLVPGKKLYYEQQKVLLTMLSSHICTQYEIEDIKENIEQGSSFTMSIKQVVKGKTRLIKIKGLCRLQDQRFNDDVETRKRLY